MPILSKFKMYGFKCCAAGILIALSGCGNTKFEAKYPQTREALEEKKMGRLTGEGGLLSWFKDGKNSKNSKASQSSNSQDLWFAILDSLHNLPVTTADRNSGVVQTDWYSDKSFPNERFRVNALIVGPLANNVAISVFKQQRRSGAWQDVGANQDLAKQIEQIIIRKAHNKAKEMKS